MCAVEREAQHALPFPKPARERSNALNGVSALPSLFKVPGYERIAPLVLSCASRLRRDRQEDSVFLRLGILGALGAPLCDLVGPVRGAVQLDQLIERFGDGGRAFRWDQIRPLHHSCVALEQEWLGLRVFFLAEKRSGEQ